MKKNHFICILLFCFSFFSCKNFLSSSDFITKLEEVIDYNNASNISVRITAEEGAGTFPAAKDLNVKVGHTFTVEFILNDSEYVFNKWKFTDSQTEQEDYESLIEYSQDVSKNVYTLTAKINSQIPNLVIKPECFLIPKATKSLPEMIEEGKPQDSPIIVIFNSPVKTEDFDGTFKNISIKTGGVEISSTYFELPKLTNDNTVLTINPLKEKPIIENLNDNSTKDVTVTLKTGKSIDVMGTVLREALFNEDSTACFAKDITWSYRINQTRDSDAPVIQEIHVYKDLTGETEITNKDYDKWSFATDGEVYTNHARFLSVKLNATDVGGGVKKIQVKEVYKKTVMGVDAERDPIYSYYLENAFENDVVVPISFQNNNDGLVKLTFSVLDYAGNESDTFDYYVIKDDHLETSLIKATPEYNEVQKDPWATEKGINGLLMTPYYSEKDGDGNNTVKITFEHINNKSQKVFYYNEGSYYRSELTYTILYSYDGVNYTTDESVNKVNDYTFTVKRKANKNTYLKIYAKDEIGNENFIERIIPKYVSILTKPKTDGDKMSFEINDLNVLYNLASDKNEIESTCYNIYYQKYDIKKKTGTGPLFSNGTGDDIPGRMYTNILGDYKFSYKNNGALLFENDETETIIYDVYCVYEFLYSDGTTWVSSLGNPYRIAVTPTGSINYVGASDKTDSKSEYVPKDFDIIVEDPVKSEGVRRITCIFPEGFTEQDGYTYYVKCQKLPVSVHESFYSNELQFTVPSGGTYRFWLMASCSGNQTWCTQNYIDKDLSEDNIPPQFNLSSVEVYSPNKIRLVKSGKPYDNENNLKSENGKYPFTYFITKSDGDNKVIDTYQKEELLAKFEPKTAVFNSFEVDKSKTEAEGSFMDFYFDEKEEGFYTLSIIAEDSNDNYSLQKFLVSNRFRGEKIYPEFQTVVNDGVEELQLKIEPVYYDNFNHEKKAKNTTYIIYSYLKSDYWIDYYDSNNRFTISANDYYPNEIVININDKKDTFIKFYTYPGAVNYDNYMSFSDIVYLCPANYDNHMVCENKNLMKCERGYQVFNDAGNPMFVHTMVSKYNYGDDAQAWINKAIETNIVFKTSASFSYNPDLSNFEKGYWYTVIVHYADGDCVMSMPVQK